MGFASLKTMDTNESIANDYTGNPTKVKFIMPSDWYILEGVTNDGYMRFGGRDYFEMIAEMNGYPYDEEKYERNPDYLRSIGLDLYFNHRDSIQVPKPVSMSYTGTYTDLPHFPEECDYQGYFYPNEKEK